jgi:hypothetical protein
MDHELVLLEEHRWTRLGTVAIAIELEAIHHPGGLAE